MTEPVDTGFDAVLAGEVWAPPEPTTAEMERGVAGHTPMRQSDTATPAPSEPSITATVTSLSPEGVQAAKALVQLPAMTPSELARLAREIAMDIKERPGVLREYKLTEPQYEFLEANNEFYKAALQAACIEWHAPLTTQERIKVEAAAILEDSLLDIGSRMRTKSEPLTGVVEAAKLFAKVAGVGERELGAGTPGERFVINIDLGGDQKLVVQSTSPPASAAQPSGNLSLPAI
jgi:hypothetical protein